MNTLFALGSSTALETIGDTTGALTATIAVLSWETPVTSSRDSWIAVVAAGAGIIGESKLTNGPVGVSRMIPAYFPLAFSTSSAASALSAGIPIDFSTRSEERRVGKECRS